MLRDQFGSDCCQMLARTATKTVKPQATNAKAKGDEEGRKSTGEPQDGPRRAAHARLAHGGGDMRLGHAATVLSQIGLSGPSIRAATLNAAFSSAFCRFPGCRR
jgi:hypothetical protein